MPEQDEPHTHKWPKKLVGHEVYTCPECGEENPGSTLLMTRRLTEEAAEK